MTARPVRRWGNAGRERQNFLHFYCFFISHKLKSTDSLTKAGYELFEILRRLRLTIAREEGLPPYIIFSDKTLIDMSIKAPTDKETILNVSGVGGAKYEKYGDRFIKAVTAFKEENPDAITSIKEEDVRP